MAESPNFVAERNARADRIHAIYLRNAARFRKLACTARLAFDKLEHMDIHHPDYWPLRDAAKGALASMDVLRARGMRLARAEVAIVFGGCRHA